MRYRDAVKLQNRDQVTVKKSNEAPEHVAMILGQPTIDRDRKVVILPIQSPCLGFVRRYHTDVK